MSTVSFRQVKPFECYLIDHPVFGKHIIIKANQTSHMKNILNEAGWWRSEYGFFIIIKIGDITPIYCGHKNYLQYGNYYQTEKITPELFEEFYKEIRNINDSVFSEKHKEYSRFFYNIIYKEDFDKSIEYTVIPFISTFCCTMEKRFLIIPYNNENTKSINFYDKKDYIVSCVRKVGESQVKYFNNFYNYTIPVYQGYEDKHMKFVLYKMSKTDIIRNYLENMNKIPFIEFNIDDSELETFYSGEDNW